MKGQLRPGLTVDCWLCQGGLGHVDLHERSFRDGGTEMKARGREIIKRPPGSFGGGSPIASEGESEL